MVSNKLGSKNSPLHQMRDETISNISNSADAAMVFFYRQQRIGQLFHHALVIDRYSIEANKTRHQIGLSK
jgi:hypothetical protein